MGQSQRAQTQQVDPLLGFSLPAGPITDNDIPQIKTVIQQVINKIDESIKSQKRSASDIQPVMSGIINLRDWLSKQKCVQQVSVPLVEAADKYNDVILLSYPGQVPINIVFNMGEKKTAEYRMLVYISTADLLKFASFIENKKI